jgi:hypothetical protein
MNKKTVILLVSIITVLLLFFFLKRNNGNTLTADEREFEFKSTDKIDKVFLSNKFTKDYVLLTKTAKDNWTVNDSFVASNYQLEILFDGLKKIRVKRPVSKHEINPVRKDLALNGTKVEIYENGNISKVFYVGGNTSDEMGTYFMMENGKEPYVCHIPGFNGFLNARFFTQKDGWRSKNIFALKDSEIKRIEIKWFEAGKSSFNIENTGAEPLLYAENTLLKNNIEVNLNHLKTYLKLWENLSFEGFPIDLDVKQIDSINSTSPIMLIKVWDKKNKLVSLRIHKKGIKRDSNIQFDEQGNPLQFDIETFYAFINENGKEVVQIQDYIFGKVMKQSTDFLIKQ